jgi:hypothetical protein
MKTTKHTTNNSGVRACITILTLCTFTLMTFGCQSSKQILASESGKIKEPQKIYKIETLDGRTINFEDDPLGYAMLRSTSIERFMKDGSIETIPLSSVKLIYTKQVDPINTVLWVVIGIAGVVLFIALTFPIVNIAG